MSKDNDSSAHLYHSTDQPLVLDAETLEPPSKKVPLDLREARRLLAENASLTVEVERLKEKVGE